MLDIDLRGDKRKRDFFELYDVTPLVAAKLPEIRNEHGCCGPVTDEFHIFRAKLKSGSGASDYVVMGPGCAKALYSMLDINPNKPVQPTGFFRKGADIPEIYHRLCPFNRQLHDAIWLLCLSWRVIPKHHSLDALAAIYQKPEQPVDSVWAEKLGATLAKDRKGRGIVGIMADLRKKLPDLRWFSFDELEPYWD